MAHQGRDKARCTRPVWGRIRGATVPQDNLIVTSAGSIGQNPCSRSYTSTGVIKVNCSGTVTLAPQILRYVFSLENRTGVEVASVIPQISQ